MYECLKVSRHVKTSASANDKSLHASGENLVPVQLQLNQRGTKETTGNKAETSRTHHPSTRILTWAVQGRSGGHPSSTPRGSAELSPGAFWTAWWGYENEYILGTSFDGKRNVQQWCECNRSVEGGNIMNQYEKHIEKDKHKTHRALFPCRSHWNYTFFLCHLHVRLR